MNTPAGLRFVLVGNPNTGKSTLFNALTGQRQSVANYPGVTVSKKLGTAIWQGRSWEVVDLPGSYSLVPRSPDERVTRDALLGEVAGVEPEVVVCVVDTSNLRRNLYLLSQVLELQLPTVVALTKSDLLVQRGERLDVAALGRALGVPVVALNVPLGQGIDALQAELDAVRQMMAAGDWRAAGHRPLPPEVYAALAQVDSAGSAVEGVPAESCERSSERRARAVGRLLRRALDASLPDDGQAGRVRQSLLQQGVDLGALEADSRYGWVDATLRTVGAVSQAASGPSASGPTATDAGSSATGAGSSAAGAGSAATGPAGLSLMDRVDSYLTHGVFGGLFFLAIMFALFFAVFQVAEPAGTWVDAGLSGMNGVVESVMDPGVFRDLLSEGVIGGVGNFVVFLPQIFVLFLFIGLLESTGYMARAAFLMDRVFSPLGLSGKSFVPLLSSFACAIPGIMATRIIERPRDRLLTIMIAPLMSCSARLPVYSLMISTLFPGQVWSKALILLAMYLLGVVVALVIVAIWKKLIWREGSPEFVLELPEFQFPQVWDVLRRAGERSWEFVVRAGTVIMALTLLIWAANYFPRNDAMFVEQEQQLETWLSQLVATPPPADAQVVALEEQIARLELEITAQRQEHSYLGQAGKWIAPVVRPLGWDWRIGCAALASFPAREVIVTTLGILYEVQDPEENVADLELALKQATWPDSGLPVFTIPVALSIMVFFALCSQCASTLAVIYQETRSIWWPILSFVYMTVLAYVGALLTYQIGTWWL